MAHKYDRSEIGGGSGGSFVLGLLAGTALGAGLGMLFAPKAGSELRSQVSEQAGNLANTASDRYRRVSETVTDIAGKGREMGREVYGKAKDIVSRGADEGAEIYGKAKDVVAQGAEEARRYVRDASSGAQSGGSHSGGGSRG